MKHFDEARRDVLLEITQKKNLLEGLSGVCLIWDVKGILRCLLKFGEGRDDIEKARQTASEILKSAAGPFWKGEIWIWSSNSSKAEEAVYEQAWGYAAAAEIGPPEIKVLDRHISKASWFNPVLEEPWPLSPNTPAVLSFYSFKGGVGRTTALASLAIQLARRGKRVAVVDLDLEAPGLSSLLPGVDEEVIEYGVIDYLLECCILRTRRDIDITDYYYLVSDPKVVVEGPPILVVPAGRLDSNYLEKLARIDYETLYAPMQAGQRAVWPLREFLRHVRAERNLDYMLIDARAGFHDLGGLTLSGMSHLDVLFCLNSEQSWRGMEMVVRFLGHDLIKRGKKQLDCALVFALAPAPGEKRSDQLECFLDRSYELFSTSYYDKEEATGESTRPVPSIDTPTEPHYPITLGFDPLVKEADHIRDIADRLSEGDFRDFGKLILERVGRALDE